MQFSFLLKVGALKQWRARRYTGLVTPFYNSKRPVDDCEKPTDLWVRNMWWLTLKRVIPGELENMIAFDSIGVAFIWNWKSMKWIGKLV